MLHYLLPALLPSWRFFDDIGPSPRLEVALLRYAADTPQQWLPFAPVAPRVGIGAMVRRLCWNPQRNEALFLLSCCERVLQHGSPVAQQQIATRIGHALASVDRALPCSTPPRCFVFRICLVTREGDGLCSHQAFVSAPQPLPAGAA